MKGERERECERDGAEGEREGEREEREKAYFFFNSASMARCALELSWCCLFSPLGEILFRLTMKQ